MQSLHEVLAYFNQYVHANWHSIVTYLVGGAGISLVVRVLTNVRQWEKGSTKLKAVGLLSLVGSASDWIINNYSTSPLATFGNIGPRLLVCAVAVHQLLEFLKKPASQLAAKLFSSSLLSVWKDAQAYRKEKATQVPNPDQFV